MYNLVALLLMVIFQSCYILKPADVIGDCGFNDWMLVDSVIVKKATHADFIYFESGMLVDADGSPRAYHPDDTGLDMLKHAGGEHGGQKEGLVYIDGKPVIQGKNDPAPGYYVSQTSLIDPAKNIADPERYVNAEVIPYVVLPPWISEKAGVKLGDIAMVINTRNDWYAFAIYADNGPSDIIGEGSMALAESLAIDKNPRHGGVSDGVQYFFFPNSGNGGPLDVKQIKRRGEKAVKAVGGMENLLKCLNKQ